MVHSELQVSLDYTVSSRSASVHSELKGSLGYIVSSRPAGITLNPMAKRKKKNQEFEKIW